MNAKAICLWCIHMEIQVTVVFPAPRVTLEWINYNKNKIALIQLQQICHCYFVMIYIL